MDTKQAARFCGAFFEYSRESKAADFRSCFEGKWKDTSKTLSETQAQQIDRLMSQLAAEKIEADSSKGACPADITGPVNEIAIFLKDGSVTYLSDDASPYSWNACYPQNSKATFWQTKNLGHLRKQLESILEPSSN